MIEYVVVYAYTVAPGKTYVPLILKKKPPHLEGMLNLPGGKINPGEDPVAAALRELKEETGLEEVQEYDPMAYCPSEYMGRINGGTCNIHAVKVPVVFQDLNPGPDEIEKVGWHSLPDLYELPNLMPNLRVIMPLIEKGIKNWVISDLDGGWRNQRYHKVRLFMDTDEYWRNPWHIEVQSVGYFRGDPE